MLCGGGGVSGSGILLGWKSSGGLFGGRKILAVLFRIDLRHTSLISKFSILCQRINTIVLDSFTKLIKLHAKGLFLDHSLGRGILVLGS